MISTPHMKTSEEMVEAIYALNLESIKFKAMDEEEGYGWTREKADRYALEYQRFLVLLAKFPDEIISPNKMVDKFWHAHILDTKKYAEDCEHIFGYFLHHFPYFGMHNEKDAANLAKAAINMRRLYAQEFGTTETSEIAFCAKDAYCGIVDAASYCGVTDIGYCGAVVDKEKINLFVETQR